MESSSNIDYENLDFILEHGKIQNDQIEPIPYTFTKLENGKKTVVDSTSIVPPRWLLLDHTIAVVWLMFSSDISSHQLNITDLKWAHEFLKEVKNSNGENPPDVKICIEEIQDRLINLYARLSYLKEGDFDQTAFGEKIFEDSRSYSLSPKKVDSKLFDKMSLATSLDPSRTTIRLEYPLFQRHSSKDLSLSIPKHKRMTINYSKKTFPLAPKNSNIFETPENGDDEEVERYFFKLLNEEKREELVQSRSSTKSFIPTKKRNTPAISISEVMSGRDTSGELHLQDKASKKVHCVAEMRSLKFQKSMKVQDMNGEEAAYSNLKAEIRRLTINPKVSKNQIQKFLKEWRLEQVGKLRNELNRLGSIDEIMKSIGTDDVQSNLETAHISVIKN